MDRKIINLSVHNVTIFIYCGFRYYRLPELLRDPPERMPEKPDCL